MEFYLLVGVLFTIYNDFSVSLQRLDNTWEKIATIYQLAKSRPYELYLAKLSRAISDNPDIGRCSSGNFRIHLRSGTTAGRGVAVSHAWAHEHM